MKTDSPLTLGERKAGIYAYRAVNWIMHLYFLVLSESLELLQSGCWVSLVSQDTMGRLSPSLVPPLANSTLTGPPSTLLVAQPKLQSHFEAVRDHEACFSIMEKTQQGPELEHIQTKGSSRENVVSFAVQQMAGKRPFRTPFLVAKLTRAML